MPSDPQAWGAFNFREGLRRPFPVPADAFTGPSPRFTTAQTGPSITFFPNRIGKLPAEVPDVFVSMNPVVEPDPERVIMQRFFEHPVGTPRARRLARQIESHQGRHGIWLCGAYLREPFLHEQAIASGQDVAHRVLATARAAA